MLRSMSVSLGQTTSLGLLSVKRSLSPKNVQRIRVLAVITFSLRLKLDYLRATPRDILTNIQQLSAKITLGPLVLKLRKGKTRSIILLLQEETVINIY